MKSGGGISKGFGGIVNSGVGNGVRAVSSGSGSFTKPVGLMQVKYLEALQNKTIPLVVSVGPAGTGKTMLACEAFVRQYNAGIVKKMVLTRPLVSVENEELGFLPGTLHQKMQPFTLPIFDILRLYYSGDALNTMLKNGVIDIVPLAFMRGRSFHHSFILADEMQNSTPNQMLMLLSRMGTNSKMVITGDLQQTDRIKSVNGLQDLLVRCSVGVGVGSCDCCGGCSGDGNCLCDGSAGVVDDDGLGGGYSCDGDIAVVQLGVKDIQRSLFVQKIMGMYKN